MGERDNSFENAKPVDHNWEAILDLDRLIPCVQGGRVVERTGATSAKAEIKVKMGAMSMTFSGTVDVAESDEGSHTVVLRVKSREVGGQGHANADVRFALSDGGGTIHTAAQITGKAASMGEGVVVSVIDGLITDFTRRLEQL